MRSALSTIRHRIVQSDDALYLTIGSGPGTFRRHQRYVGRSKDGQRRLPPRSISPTQNPHHGSGSSPTSNKRERERARIKGGAS